VFDLSDRFGAHGVVGVITCQEGTSPDSWEIDTWLMSCRVLGRQLERTMLDCAVHAARASGISRLIGVYRPTAKNALVADLFQSLGFAAVLHADGESRYHLDLANVEGTSSTFIDLVPSSDTPAGVATPTGA
jgi:predicted enzyme involved in methoxymalonyl-ACP biosynthesis